MTVDPITAVQPHVAAQLAVEGLCVRVPALPTGGATIIAAKETIGEKNATVHSPHPTSTSEGASKTTVEVDRNLTMMLLAMARHATPATNTPHASGAAHRMLDVVPTEFGWRMAIAKRAAAENAPRVSVSLPQS